MFLKDHSSLFKDSKGRYLTIALFFEYRFNAETDVSVFNLKDDDHVSAEGKTYISLKKKYMSYEHVPGFEHEFACAELGGWAHWEKLQGNKYLREAIEEWRREYDIALRCRAIKSIMANSTSNDAKGLAAAKWLAEKGWADKRPGRISKEELARERAIATQTNEQLADDMQRLGLSVVNGGR